MKTKENKKKDWVSPKIQILQINTQTANGMSVGAETLMMGMLSNGS